MTDQEQEEFEKLKAELAAKNAEIALLKEGKQRSHELDEAQEEAHWRDWDKMQAAKSNDDERRAHILRIGEQTIGIRFGALGCCLRKLYSQARDHGTLKEGERFSCFENCGTFARNWIVTKGILEKSASEKLSEATPSHRESAQARGAPTTFSRRVCKVRLPFSPVSSPE